MCRNGRMSSSCGRHTECACYFCTLSVYRRIHSLALRACIVSVLPVVQGNNRQHGHHDWIPSDSRRVVTLDQFVKGLLGTRHIEKRL